MKAIKVHGNIFCEMTEKFQARIDRKTCSIHDFFVYKQFRDAKHVSRFLELVIDLAKDGALKAGLQSFDFYPNNFFTTNILHFVDIEKLGFVHEKNFYVYHIRKENAQPEKTLEEREREKSSFSWLLRKKPKGILR